MIQIIKKPAPVQSFEKEIKKFLNVAYASTIVLQGISFITCFFFIYTIAPAYKTAAALIVAGSLEAIKRTATHHSIRGIFAGTAFKSWSFFYFWSLALVLTFASVGGSIYTSLKGGEIYGETTTAAPGQQTDKPVKAGGRSDYQQAMDEINRLSTTPVSFGKWKGKTFLLPEVRNTIEQISATLPELLSREAKADQRQQEKQTAEKNTTKTRFLYITWVICISELLFIVSFVSIYVFFVGDNNTETEAKQETENKHPTPTLPKAPKSINSKVIEFVNSKGEVKKTTIGQAKSMLGTYKRRNERSPTPANEKSVLFWSNVVDQATQTEPEQRTA